MTVSYDRARMLITSNSPCYTPEDAERIFGFAYSNAQRDFLKTVPFTEDVLRECAGTHMLFPGFSLTALEVRDAFVALVADQGGHVIGPWYHDEQHTKQIQVKPAWYLLRMNALPESLGKELDDLRTLLRPDEEIPSIPVALYAAMLHYGVTEECLFEEFLACTTHIDPCEGRIYLSFLGTDVIFTGSNSREPGVKIGLAPLRKPETLPA